MDSWTSKESLYRDLAIAQGGTPLTIPEPSCFRVSHRYEYEKEKEEHNLRDANATADFSNGPDINLIRKMLEMVNECEAPMTESNCFETSNLNPNIPEFFPNSFNAPETPKVTTKKKYRNAAIESIMNAQEANSKMIGNIPFASKSKLKNDPKINVDIEKKHNGSARIFNSNIGSSMFKKKELSNSKTEPGGTRVPQATFKTPYNVPTFKPSKLANSYYEKFVKFNEEKNVTKNVIWELVEQKIKEFEVRKHKEDIENISSVANDSYIFEDTI